MEEGRGGLLEGEFCHCCGGWGSYRGGEDGEGCFFFYILRYD